MIVGSLEDDARAGPRSTRDGSPRKRGGVLLRIADRDDGAALGFIPASIAKRLTALSSLTAVPGARPPVAGIALADGAVVTVLRVGAAHLGGRERKSWPEVPPEDAPRSSRRMSYAPGADWIVPGADRAVLCKLGGIEVAVTGATVLATGVFDAAPGSDGVVWREVLVPVVDVRALYAQAEAATWAGRSAASAPPSASHAPIAHANDEGDDTGRPALLPQAPELRESAEISRADRPSILPEALSGEKGREP